MNEDLVTVATFPDSIQAHLAIQHLAASGIRAILSGESLADANFMGIAIGGAKVLVAKEDALRAVAALEARFDEPDVPSDAITIPDESIESHGKYEDLPDEDVAEEEERVRALAGFDEEVPIESERSQKIDRAFKATLFGFLFFPLFFYAWWLLFDVLTIEGAISDRARKRLWITLALNATLGVACLFSFCFRPSGLFD